MCDIDQILRKFVAKLSWYTMIISRRVSAAIPQIGHCLSLGKNGSKLEQNIVAQFSSTSSAKKVDYDKLEVPSRYQDVTISNKPYFDFVWENRERHFNKVAMVGKQITDPNYFCCLY